MPGGEALVLLRCSRLLAPVDLDAVGSDEAVAVGVPRQLDACARVHDHFGSASHAADHVAHRRKTRHVLVIEPRTPAETREMARSFAATARATVARSRVVCAESASLMEAIRTRRGCPEHPPIDVDTGR